MKICFVIPSLSGGGAEKQLGYLSEYLSKNHIQLHIIYRSEGPCNKNVFIENVKYHKLKSKSNYNPLAMVEIFFLLKKIQPKIIQTWIIQSDILIGLINIIIRKNWIVREANIGRQNKGLIKKTLRYHLVKRADVVVANSNLGEEFWKNSNKTKLILNGFNFLTSKFESNKIEEPNILYVGRLTPHKNVDKLIKAYFKSNAVNTHKLYICGDGNQKEDLKILCKSLKVSSKVRFFGFLPPEEILNKMQNTDLFCLLSDYEGMPNVVIEAMYQEAPILLSASKSHKSLFKDNLVTFCNHEDIIETSKQIDNLLLRTDTEKLKLAKTFSESLTIENMGKNYLNVYQKITNNL